LLAVIERLAADELEALGAGRDAEGEHVALLAVADAGLRIDQDLVGGRAVGGEHFRAAHDQAILVLLDHAEMGELVVLLVRALGAVGLRIDDGVGLEQVALAAELVIVADVVGELPAALAEEIRVLGPGHQDGVEKIRRAAEHAEAGVGPDLHRLPAFDEIGVAARREERRAEGAAVLVRMGHDVAMSRRDLQVVERSDGAHRSGKRRIGRNVLDPPSAGPDLARVATQAVDELASASHRHSNRSSRHDIC
jgi:hypothetical protein